MTGGLDVTVTFTNISPNFPLFYGHTGVKSGVKLDKKCAHLPIIDIVNVIF